jgi:hypothetical protein
MQTLKSSETPILSNLYPAVFRKTQSLASAGGSSEYGNGLRNQILAAYEPLTTLKID